MPVVTGISNIFIYTEPRCEAVDYAAVSGYVEQLLPDVKVTLREPLLEASAAGGGMRTAQLAESLAAARVRSLAQPQETAAEPLPGEVEYERRRLLNADSRVFGVLYDAWLISELYQGLVPAGEAKLSDLNIVFTNQLIGSWDPADNRYHARTVILGAPSLISTSGMAIAPAKAPGYYIARRSSAILELQEEAKNDLARSFAGECLELDDSRLTAVAQGMVMQAVFYRLTGEPFCLDRNCRLFNAHWQSELIQAQLGEGNDFCPGHSELLAKYRAQGEKPWI